MSVRPCPPGRPSTRRPRARRHWRAAAGSCRAVPGWRSAVKPLPRDHVLGRRGQHRAPGRVDARGDGQRHLRRAERHLRRRRVRGLQPHAVPAGHGRARRRSAGRGREPHRPADRGRRLRRGTSHVVTSTWPSPGYGPVRMSRVSRRRPRPVPASHTSRPAATVAGSWVNGDRRPPMGWSALRGACLAAPGRAAAPGSTARSTTDTGGPGGGLVRVRSERPPRGTPH